MMRPFRLQTCALFAAAMLFSALNMPAQDRSTVSFANLRADGNGVRELQSNIDAGFAGTAASAFNAVAVTARLNLTFDATLPALAKKIAIRPHNRSAAQALIEIAQASGVRLRVSDRSQIVIDVETKAISRAPDVARSMSRVDSAVALPVALEGVRIESERVELGRFKHDASVTTFVASGKELRTVPTFVEPDVLRSVQTLPGIQSRSDWTAGFNIHGGEADQTSVSLDGFQIYSPFHAGGLFSAFIDPMVGGIELHSGALPARYGGRLSGVLDVKSAEPTSKDWNGSATVSLASSSATIGRAFRDDNGGWIVGGRRTYLDLVLSTFGQNGMPYHFEDLGARITRNVIGLQVGITAYASKDALARSEVDGDQGTSGNWSNSMFGLSLGRTRTKPTKLLFVKFDSVAVEQRLSVSGYNAGVFFGEYQSGASNAVRDWRGSGSIALHRQHTQTTFGYELASQHLRYNAASPLEEYERIIPFDVLSQANSSTSAFVEHVWRPTPSLVVNIGGRAEQSTAEQGLGISPRLAVKFFITPKTAISLGGGRVTQIIHSLGREEEFLQPLQFWVLSDSARRASTVKDAVLGVERWWSPNRMLHLGAYYKQYDRLLTANHYSDARVSGDAFVANSGTSYGADFMLRQLDGGKYSGWISYSYALGLRTDDFGRSVSPPQDRRHNMNLVANRKSGNFAFGGRVGIASGFPTTPELGEFVRGQYDPYTQRWIASQSSNPVIEGVHNSVRLPVYRRIDLSATRFGHLRGAPTSTYLSVVNVLNLRNPAGYLYDYGRSAKRVGIPNLPFIPTMGVSIVY